MIEGHNCNIGSERYNQDLSERRAETVKRYLIQEGTAQESKISTVSYDESRPIAYNDTRDGKAQNRRAEVLIMFE